MRRLFSLRIMWFLTTIFSAACVHGQVVEGIVSDSNNLVIPYASVSASACSDDRILAFVLTNESGFFRLNLNTECDTIRFTARCLGYRTATVAFGKNDLPVKLDIKLESTVLEEVVIRAKQLPVIVKNDTTEYHAASFSDSTEFSVEDLLKKIPGVQVSQSGVISYYGRSVERVLVEGDDLFYDHYQNITQNLRADMISKIQVIDHYEANPVLKDIQSTEKLVMNLKIKPDRKRTLSGAVTGGLGYVNSWKGEAAVSAISLSRKDKTYLFANMNNSGTPYNLTTDDRMLMLRPDRFSLESNPLFYREVVQTEAQETLGLPAAFTTENQSAKLIAGEVIPFKNGLKLTLSGFAGQNLLNQSTYLKTIYTIDNQIIRIEELKKNHWNFQNKTLTTDINFISPNQKFSLRTFVNVGATPGRSESSINRSQVLGNDQLIPGLLQGKTFKSIISSEVAYKIHKKMAVQGVVKFAAVNAEQTLQSTYNLYPDYFSLDSSFTRLFQNIEQKQQKTQSFIRFLASHAIVKWQVEAGFESGVNKLFSSIYLQNTNKEVWSLAAPDYINDFRLDNPFFYGKLNATVDLKVLLIRTELTGKYLHQQTTNDQAHLNASRQGLWEPHLQVIYPFTQKSSFNSFYKFKQQAPSIYDLFPAYIFSDYQTLRQGLVSLNLVQVQQAGLHYNFKNEKKFTYFNLGIDFIRSENQFGRRYLIDPRFTVLGTYRPVNNESWMIAGNFSRFFPEISCRFEIGGNLMRLSQQALINAEVPEQLNSLSKAYHLNIGTAFDTWVNFVFGLQGNFYRFNNQGMPVNTKGLNENLGVTIRPNKKISMKINVFHVSNEAIDTTQNFFGADCWLSYSLPKWRSNIFLQGFNLTNSQNFSQITSDNFIQSVRSIQAIQPFWMLSWSYAF